MINSLFKKCAWCNADSGLLALRIGVGIIFIYTGWLKVSNLDMTVGFFATMGFSAFWAYLVAFVELLGGIAVLLGIWTSFAALPLAVIMVVVSFLLRSDLNMMMTPVILFFSAIALALAGGGKYSLKQEKTEP
jgi:putative oxidoreductase